MGKSNDATPVIPGRILIAGTGYIVLCGMWLILAYFRNQGNENLIALLNLTLAILHVVVGVAIYYRLRFAWYLGLAVAALGVAAAIPNAYPFPVGPELVLAVILYLTRRDFMRPPAA